MVPRVDPQPRPELPQRTISTNSTKHSVRSYTSSFEADDELSSSAQDSMGPEHGYRDAPATYAGEDTRLTSQKELHGWYSYGFAAEVFVICGMGSFIPITLETLARENGVLISDLKTPCGSSTGKPGPGSDHGSPKDGQCVVFVGGLQINTASFAMYTFSLSVLFQALLVISISCAADHGNSRKRILIFFAVIGSVATMLFLPIISKLYLLAALLAIISNTCFGASFVLLNSFLPLLVRHHPSVQFATPDRTPELATTLPSEQPSNEELDVMEHRATPGDRDEPPRIALGNESPYTAHSKELQLSTRISSYGIGIGYTAGLFLQCVSILVVFLMKSSTFSLRLVLCLVGAWWLLFTIPAALWLRPRPGPPLPTKGGASRSWFGYLTYAWASLWRTVKLARRLKDIVLFLGAWFLLSDAIATVSGTAVLYAKTQLHMAPAALGLINVIATTAGVIGAFSWAAVSRYFGLRPHQTILACICLFELIPLYSLLGYLPVVKRWGVVGLQEPWEMYPLGFVYGLVLGGLSSYCRSLFGELIPPGSEAAFYALYAITDKGSSVFGPAIVGVIVDRTGEIRPAFWFLAVLVGLPAPLIYFVNVERGKREGRKLAEVIEGRKTTDDLTSAEFDPTEEGQRLLATGEDDEDDNELRNRT